MIEYGNRSPENPRASDYSLPQVSEQIGESLVADAQERGMDSLMRQAEERLMTNNPNLYAAVGQFAVGMGLESPEAIKAAHSIMIMTHELLRRQAETDALEDMVSPPQEDPLH